MGTQASASRGRAKPSGGGFAMRELSALGSMVYLGQAGVPLTSGEWLASERQKRALGSARAAQENSDGGTGDKPRS